MEIIQTNINPDSEDFYQNSQHHKQLANELKERLAHSLRPMGVRKAYLAVVSYGERKGPQNAAGDGAEPGLNVALCVSLQDETAGKQEIVQRAGHDFAAMFGPSQHMDIIFLTDQQEAALHKVCRPFYMAMEAP